MTVSKALRDETDISAATKAKIKLLAQELGYVPDSVAQGLRSRKTKLLGLVISSITNPVFARMILALEEQCYELGYDLVIAQTRNLAEREEAQIRRMLSRRVDGIFISPVYRLAPTAPIYEELKRRGLPVVILGHHATFCAHFANVEADDIRGSYDATKHLLDLGHRRIAFFTGPVASPFAQERYEGYRRALREVKLEPDDKLVFHAGTTIEEGEKAALQLLNEMPNATAVHGRRSATRWRMRKPRQKSSSTSGTRMTRRTKRMAMTAACHPGKLPKTVGSNPSFRSTTPNHSR